MLKICMNCANQLLRRESPQSTVSTCFNNLTDGSTYLDNPSMGGLARRTIAGGPSGHRTRDDLSNNCNIVQMAWNHKPNDLAFCCWI